MIKVAVVIAIETGKGILLTKRGKAVSHHPGEWVLPGGKKEDIDQDMEDCARRELTEETGLIATDMMFLFTHLSEQWELHVYFTQFIGGRMEKNLHSFPNNEMDAYAFFEGQPRPDIEPIGKNTLAILNRFLKGPR